jgi:hypothetical protein
MISSLSPSLWVLSSLGRPGPPCTLAVGNFGRFVGSRDDSSRSDTLLGSDAVGIAYFLPAAAAGWVEVDAVGGNEGFAGEGGSTLRSLSSSEVRVRSGGCIGLAADGTWMWLGKVDMIASGEE